MTFGLGLESWIGFQQSDIQGGTEWQFKQRKEFEEKPGRNWQEQMMEAEGMVWQECMVGDNPEKTDWRLHVQNSK